MLVVEDWGLEDEEPIDIRLNFRRASASDKFLTHQKKLPNS